MSIDILDALENDYAARLTTRAAEWIAKHPEEAATLRAEAWEKMRRAGQSFPEPQTMQGRMVDAAVVEAIRKLKKWPSIREFMALQAGKEPV